MMRLPTAIFFDLDDTIISYNDDAIPLWEEVCNTYCQKTGRFPVQQLLDVLIRSANWYWSDKERHRTGRLNLTNARREVVKLAFQELGVSDFTGAYKIADEFSAKRLERITLFPGAKETLQLLYQQEIRLALVTNGNAEEQKYKIAKFDLHKYFEGVFIESELGFGKPDRRVYLMVLERLHVAPNEVWMVGDNLEWDVGAPQQLGIYGIWHDYRKKGLPDSSIVIPDRIIHRISELIE
jgi:putative hydrolase of the HAD superfamily